MHRKITAATGQLSIQARVETVWELLLPTGGVACNGEKSMTAIAMMVDAG